MCRRAGSHRLLLALQVPEAMGVFYLLPVISGFLFPIPPGPRRIVERFRGEEHPSLIRLRPSSSQLAKSPSHQQLRADSRRSKRRGMKKRLNVNDSAGPPAIWGLKSPVLVGRRADRPRHSIFWATHPIPLFLL